MAGKCILNPTRPSGLNLIGHGLIRSRRGKSVEFKVLAIESAIGVLRHPLAQDNHAAVTRHGDVACHMQVAEDVGLYIAMGSSMLLHKVLEMVDALLHPLVDLVL